MMKNHYVRYLLAFLVLIVLCALFAIKLWGMHPVHFWNRIMADASFVMLCLTLIIGPAVQFVPRLWPLSPWRRELGVVAALAALVHVVIYMKSFRWNPLGFFIERGTPHLVWKRDAFASSNWVGLLALGIILILALTANDFSQKWLGKGWKFLQQQNYGLFALTFVHIFLFLYLVNEVSRGSVYTVFWWLSLITVGFQIAGFVRTVWLNARRRGIIDP